MCNQWQIVDKDLVIICKVCIVTQRYDLISENNDRQTKISNFMIDSLDSGHTLSNIQRLSWDNSKQGFHARVYTFYWHDPIFPLPQSLKFPWLDFTYPALAYLLTTFPQTKKMWKHVGVSWDKQLFNSENSMPPWIQLRVK